jgi:hypothetical protein
MLQRKLRYLKGEEGVSVDWLVCEGSYASHLVDLAARAARDAAAGVDHRPDDVDDGDSSASGTEADADADADGETVGALPTEPVWTAQYDFADADDERVLKLAPGDVLVEVSGEPELPGWVTATLERTGQRGIIPANYIEEARRVVVAAAPVVSAGGGNGGGGGGGDSGGGAATVRAPSVRSAPPAHADDTAEQTPPTAPRLPELVLEHDDFVVNELPELALEPADYADVAEERAGGAAAVRRAWYGDPNSEWFVRGGGGVDVTIQAKAAVVDGKIRLVASNALAGNPPQAWGAKLLVVEYRHVSGDVETETTLEGQLFEADVWNWVVG